MAKNDNALENFRKDVENDGALGNVFVKMWRKKSWDDMKDANLREMQFSFTSPAKLLWLFGLRVKFRCRYRCGC